MITDDTQLFASFDRLHAASQRVKRLQAIRTRLIQGIEHGELVRLHVDRSDASGSAEVTAYRGVDATFHVRIEVLAVELRITDVASSSQIEHVLDFAEDVLQRCRIV
jgi:hypothetical protein